MLNEKTEESRGHADAKQIKKKLKQLEKLDKQVKAAREEKEALLMERTQLLLKVGHIGQVGA